MSKYEDLEVWKLSHKLVVDIYRKTSIFPKDERFRLSDQLCRAVSSIPMNICEGTGRKTKKDFVHFLYIARGSLQETKYQLLLAKDLDYITNTEYNDFKDRCDSISRLLNGLINKLSTYNNELKL